jgi:diacylglycerol kinase family enzyme
MKVAVLINPRSGTASRMNLREEPVRAAFQQADIDADVQIVDRRFLKEALRVAVGSGVEAIVVGGGDGTISTAAGVLAGGDVPLGVLPLGTSNHFARDLGIPLTMDGAIRTIRQGTVRRLGVGEVNGHVFVNNSVLGFYPRVVKVRRAIRKRFSIDKRLARLLAGIVSVPHFSRLHLHLDVEGERFSRVSPLVFIGTNPYQMNAFRFGAPLRAEGGDLFIYLARSSGRMGLLLLFAQGLLRDVSTMNGIDKWVAPAFRIDAVGDSVSVFTDGELFTLTPPLYYRGLPNALPVLAPSG